MCETLKVNKRGEFDVQGQRIEGTLAEEYKGKIQDVEHKERTEWRKQHEEMKAAIKQAKKTRPKTPGSADPTVQICT